MDTPTRGGRAAVAAGTGTLIVAAAGVALVFGGSGGSSLVQTLPAAEATTSPTATSTPAPTSTPTPTATVTPNPTASGPAPPGPGPTLGAPFGYLPGRPYAYGQPWTSAPPVTGAPPADSGPADLPPGQAHRYRMYTCTTYEVKEGAPAAYHCVPEIDRYAEQRRYDGFYGGQQNQGYGTGQQPQAYPQQQYYPTQPYTYPSPSTGSIYFADCTAARNAGYSNIQRGAAGYSTTLDRDNDGIACEAGE